MHQLCLHKHKNGFRSDKQQKARSGKATGSGVPRCMFTTSDTGVRTFGWNIWDVNLTRGAEVG